MFDISQLHLRELRPDERVNHNQPYESSRPSGQFPASSTAPGQIAIAFILAGKAVFTIVGCDGRRHTYEVRERRADGDQYLKPVYFVGVLTGPDNTASYTYLGIVSPGNGFVTLTENSRVSEDMPVVVLIRWAFKHVWQGKALPPPAGIHHEGRCGRCGRLLTVPDSILSGIGPECAKRICDR
jgi:hypothetical protein